MSRPFEANLARWFFEQADELDIQAGDRYAAEFPDNDTAAGLCEALLDVSESVSMREVTYEGETERIPTIEISSTPMHVVQVCRAGDEVNEKYQVSRWYATTMRNVLAKGQEEDTDVALLMIYEVGVGIETLETTHGLFTDDGRLPLRRFQERIRSNYTPLGEQGKAIVRAIDDAEATGGHDTLTFPEDPMEDLGPLKAFCKVYDACAMENGDTLPELIPEVGIYLHEEAFGDEWFEEEEEEDYLFEQAQQLLRENHKHASRIAEATRVARDAESELGAYYTDEFIDTVLELRDWRTLSRTDAAAGELSTDSTGSSEGTRSGTTGNVGTGTTTGKKVDQDPSFDSLDIQGEKVNVYGSSEETSGYRNIVAAVTDGSFEATVTYDLDVSDEPRSFVDSSGEEVKGVSCDNEDIDISLSGLDPDAPHFYSLKVFVGHKTPRGSPENQFDIALVPEWFFGAITDDTYGINVEGEALVIRNENAISLDPLGNHNEDDRIVEDLTSQQQTVTLSQPLLLNPKSPPNVDRLQCKVVASEDTPVPVTIEFITEVEEPSQAEIQLPLSFTALTTPDDWANDELQINSAVVTDLGTGEFHSPNRGRIEIPQSDRRLLQIEQSMVEAGTIAKRERTQIEVGTGKPQSNSLSSVSSDLIDAYTQLFNHFDERGTVPSTDRWDSETQECVEDVLDAYVQAVHAIDDGASSPIFDPYRHLGTIRSTAVDKVWLTPFQPLILAYALRLSNWRDELVEQGLTDGFRFSRFNALFSPVGMNPYRWDTQSDDILLGQSMANNHLWASYGPIKGLGSKTPEYISEVVADKLEAFTRAFDLLLRLHEDRELKINLVNMGELGPVIQGLYDFFNFVDDHPDMNIPQITLQLYGGDTEGRALEQFFATESADSALRDRLSDRDSSNIIDELDRRVTYVHCGEEFNEEMRRPAHLTLFRGLLKEQSGAVDVDTFPKATRMDGLLPRDQLLVDSSGGDIVSKSGAAFNPEASDRLSRVGAAVNALEASVRDGALSIDRSLSKIITASDQTNLPKIWEHSLWVLHVQPKVDIGFYVESTSKVGNISDDTLMIHYSDQYDADSPGFDVITTTDKRDPYQKALERELDAYSGLDELDPGAVLSRLVAIDGELALDIQQSSDNTMELVGLVGGLAVSAELLARELPTHEWIPISLNEFARHDRRYRGDSEGLLQYFTDGSASDDLCFIGVPEDSDASELSLKLWVVETKGGTSGIGKGVEQVQGAVEKLTELFDPDGAYADTGVLRSEFGEVISRIATRLYHYNVISENRRQTVFQHADRLADGDYSIDVLKDAQGHAGEVIRIQRDLYLPELDTREDVRILKLPVSVLSLINTTPTGDNEIHPELNSSGLRFNSPDETRVEASSATETQTAKSDGETEAEATQSTSDEPVKDEPTVSGDKSETHSSHQEDQGDEVPTSDEDGSTGEDAKESRPEEEVSKKETEEKPTESDEVEEPTETESSLSEESESGQTGPSAGRSGYSWCEEDFKLLTNSLTEGSAPDLSIDVSRLTSDLKEQFTSLGIDVYEPNPADVSIGPRKIGVNVRPKSGQKIESVLNALNSISVHIKASGTITGVPNPAEGAIRLEIPHGKPQDVPLRSGFEELHSTLLDPLHVPLGVNTENEHIAVDLLEEHHMLIGGATGSGKSNFLGASICSLAASQPPSRLRISLLDPKGIDFGRFQAFPQVDTYEDTPEDCVEYLRTLLTGELENRRDKLQDRGVASVQEYNRLADQDGTEPIPYRVIVIDEFADLIMALTDSQDDFEEAVGRLAQIGRALGYSVLLATQRPDADIVSGSIKTNFNCRVSFELPSNTDSRVILDQPGAEDLEGAGDMIALTSSGEEYHLQAYRLLPEDAITIRDRLNTS